MSDDTYHDSTQAEFITIVEGPTPDFTPASEDWPWSLLESANGTVCALCELRTFDGEALLNRCRAAWRQGRPVRLDYPDGSGGRQEADIVAARTDTVDQGDVIYLWVAL